jgi:hypothetical protein
MAHRRFTRRARLAALRNLKKARRALRRRTRTVRRATHRRRFTAKARRAALRNLRKARAARRSVRRVVRRVRHGRAYRTRLARLRSLRLARRAKRTGRTKRAYAAIDQQWETAYSPGSDFFGMGVNPKKVSRTTKRGKNVAARKRIAAALKRRRRLKGRVVVFPGGRIAVFHKPGTAAFRAGRAKKKAMGRRLARLFGFKKHRKARKGRKARRRNPGFMWR